VAVQSNVFANPNGAVEVKDVWVDPHLKLLRFEEDLRPPYVGTYSKKSSVLNGRRPFFKDSALFNYDYDSEAEWEEESVGEDIVESVNEEEEGGNELEFDDFLLHDNDLGSDYDSDGEGVTMPQSRRMSQSMTVEVLGPRFTAAADVVYSSLGLGADGSMQSCPVNDKDTVKLHCHFTVFHKFDMLALGCSVEAESTDRGAKGGVVPEEKKGAPKFSDVTTTELASLVHGKKDSLDKLVASFQALYPDFKEVLYCVHSYVQRIHASNSYVYIY
jgi:hypothetical protein